MANTGAAAAARSPAPYGRLPAQTVQKVRRPAQTAPQGMIRTAAMRSGVPMIAPLGPSPFLIASTTSIPSIT